MIHQDQVEVEKLNAKNALEEFIYEMKDKTETTLAEFMSEEVRSTLVHMQYWRKQIEMRYAKTQENR